MRRRVLIEAGVVWNSIWSHGHEVAKALAAEYDVFYLEPVRTKAPHAHLHEKGSLAVPKHVTLVQHERILDDLGAEYWRYSEQNNLRLIKEIKPDILLTYQCLLGFAAFRHAKSQGVKIIYMLVDEYAALSKSLPVKAYLAFAEPYFLRNSDGILCTAKTLEQRAKKYRGKVLYVPNGINRSNLAKMAGGVRKGTHKRLIIGFVGTLGQWVDPTWFTTIAAAYPEVDVHVIGGGEGYEWLKKQPRKSNLKLFGFMQHKEAIARMRDFDIALIPFKVNRITHAVSPIKLFEYWSMGKPVVAPRTKELEQYSEIVFSDDSLVAQVGTLIKSKQQRMLYGKRGKRLVPKYDWSILGKKILAFVKRV